MRLIVFTIALFIALLFQADCAAQSVVSEREVQGAATERILGLSPIGSCASADGPVDLSRLWHLENRSVDVLNRRVRLNPQSVGIELLDSTPPQTLVYNIPWMVSDEQQGDPDIELKLVLLDEQLAVYWRETYQHRQYRQGLFRVVDARLVRWCEGWGGISSSH